jgi:tetratricopeptide (TPR) repeat protein
MRLLCVATITLCVALSAGLTGCGESAREFLATAKTALADSRYDEAVGAAEAGLAQSPDEVTAWGLELVKLEALARGGQAEDTLAQLEKLAGQRPEQVPADQYAATADQLRSAEQGGAAIQALDLGLKRFPENDQLLAQIEAAKAAPAPGSDELEMLRSLGYVND